MSKRRILIATAILMLMLAPSLQPIEANPPQTTKPTATVTTVRTVPNKAFTLAQVAKFNGKNGAKAYVVYKGIVYDVTKVSEFKTGTYKSMKVGTDITALLRKLANANNLLKKFSPVGKLLVVTTKTTAAVQSMTTTVAKPITTTAPATSGSTGTNGAVFTLEALAKYNGENGQPAYVAVDGIVYDVSALSEWNGGLHYRGIEAGKDLSVEILSSPHGKTILKRAVIVGTLKK